MMYVLPGNAFGMVVSTGRRRVVSTSCGVRNDGSKYSTTKTKPTAAQSDSIKPTNNFVRADVVGSAGTAGGSTIETFIIRARSRAADILDSFCFRSAAV